MGYACPVCDDPQADAEHLANHLAFTAMLRGAGHETWLDEHVDGWADLAPEELAERVRDHADEKEFPQVFEDTTGGHGSGRGHDHGHAHGGHGGHQSGNAGDRIENAAPSGVADIDVDGDQEDVLAEARELTRQRRSNAADGAGADDGDGDADDAIDEDGEATGEDSEATGEDGDTADGDEETGSS